MDPIATEKLNANGLNWNLVLQIHAQNWQGGVNSLQKSLRSQPNDSEAWEVVRTFSLKEIVRNSQQMFFTPFPGDWFRISKTW